MDRIPGSSRLIKRPELAAYLGVSMVHISVLQRRGVIPFIKIGHSTRYRLKDVLAALDRLTVRGEGGRQ
jgi:hypothetical protein